MTTATVEPGDEVGAWVVEASLGEGAMALVFAAQHRASGQRGALKLLRPEHAGSPTVAGRFAREARALASIESDAVVPVLDAGKLEDGTPWLVTAQLEGHTLRDEIAARGRLPAAEAWAIARAILDGLAAAHPLGVVHRDLKPANVFLERRSEGVVARIIDFGLAKVPTEAGEADLSRTGVALGTPAYMAPEQWWGERTVDGRADLYALGATLFEMLVGAPPFVTTSEAELVQAVLHEPPPSPRARGAPVGTGVDVFVRRLLAKAPDDRFPNAFAARMAGDHAFEAEPAVAPAAAPTPSEVTRSEASGVVASAPLAGSPAPSATPAASTLSSSAPAAPASPSIPSPAEVPAHGLPSPTPPVWATSSAPGAAQGTGHGAVVVPGPERSRFVAGYMGAHAILVVAGVAVLVLLGYVAPAPHDVGGWMRDGGWGMVPLVLAFVAAVALVPRAGLARAFRGEPGRVAFALAAAPVAFAALGTWIDWMVVRNTIAPLPPTEAFAVLHQGVVEANVPRFVGFGLGAIAFLAVAGMPRRRFKELRYVRWRVVDVAAVALLLATLVTALLGVASGAYVLVVAGSATMRGRDLSHVPSRLRFAEAVDHAVASLAATLLALGAAFARLDGRAAAAFGDVTATRAERVAAIVAIEAERDASRWAAGIAVLVVLGIATARLVHLRPRQGRLRLARSSVAVLLGMPAFFAIDAAQSAAVDARRSSIEEALAPQLALFAQLDPPRAVEGHGLGPPAQAPALQVTTTAVAVNGEPTARLEALDAEAARDGVVQALARALAATSPAPNQPDLALVADRGVPWREIRGLLRLARQAGARRVEVLLTRGAPPTIAPGAPAEAAAIVPTDMVALPITIAVDGASASAASFEEMAAAWQEAHAEGAGIVVGVGW